MKITIIGAGGWGGALAQVLGDNGHDVVLWSRSQHEVDMINQKHQITALALKKIDHDLPLNITATTHLGEALSDSPYVLFAVPSSVFREVVKATKQYIVNPVVFISATKGMEVTSHQTMSQIIESEIAAEYRQSVVALSGPSHAEEVIKRCVTAVVSASPDISYAHEVQELFNNNTYFRVYVNSDRIGVEVAAALKNIIAVLSGMATQYELGDNAKAALITRGLFEIVKIGLALGGQERTFSGLAGLGDLIVTTTSFHSRNFQAGMLLAQGMELKDIEHHIGGTVEGIYNVYSAHEIIERLAIYAPLIDLLYQILTGNVAVKDGLEYILNREMKDEFMDMS